MVVVCFLNLFFHPLVIQQVQQKDKAMQNSAQNIIEQLRQKVEDDAQRKSEKLKAEKDQLKQHINNETKPINIFANMKKPEATNLFGSNNKSVNLFSIQPKPQSSVQGNGANPPTRNIFNVQQKPVIENADSDQDKEQDEEGVKWLEGSQATFKSEPDVKVMKYEYKNQLTKLHEITVRKFKNGTAMPREEIYLSLEYLPNQPSSLYMIVRSCKTKVIVYQGILIKNMTRMENFMGKHDNLRFDVVKKSEVFISTGLTEEENTKQNKLQKELVKLQFEKVQDCEEFVKKVNTYFEGK